MLFYPIKCWPIVESKFRSFIEFYFPTKNHIKTDVQIDHYIKSRKARVEWFVKLPISKRTGEEYGLFNTIDDDRQFIENIANAMNDYAEKINYNAIAETIGWIVVKTSSRDGSSERIYNDLLEQCENNENQGIFIDKNVFLINNFSKALEANRDTIIKSKQRFCEDLKSTGISESTVRTLLKPGSGARDYWPYVGELLRFIRDRFTHTNLEAITKNSHVLRDFGLPDNNTVGNNLFLSILVNYFNSAFPDLVPVLYEVKKKYPKSDFGSKGEKFKGDAWKITQKGTNELSESLVKMFVENSYLGAEPRLPDKDGIFHPAGKMDKANRDLFSDRRIDKKELTDHLEEIVKIILKSNDPPKEKQNQSNQISSSRSKSGRGTRLLEKRGT